MAHGVRKVNEYVVRDGRALIMTQNVANGISDKQWASIADGTFYLKPSDGTLRYKKTGSNPKDWAMLDPVNVFDEDSIVNSLMAENSIGAEQLCDNAVETRKIANKQVTGYTPAAGSTPAVDGKLAFNTVHEKNIVKRTITGRKNDNNNEGCIADRTITQLNVAFDTITGGETRGQGNLAQGAVWEYNLHDLCVSTGKLRDLAVETAKIANGAITGYVDANNPGKIALETITNKNLASKSVTGGNATTVNGVTSYTGKIALDTVTGGKKAGEGNIAPSTIEAYNLAPKCVTEAKIENEQVTGGTAAAPGKIKGDTITGHNVKKDTITGGKGRNLGNIAEATIHAYNVAKGTLDYSLLDGYLYALNGCPSDKRTEYESSLYYKTKNAVYQGLDGNTNVLSDLVVDGNIQTRNPSSTRDTQSITGFKVYNPVFADYAEGFVTSEPVEPGDIVEIDQYGCVKKADCRSRKVVGVVSDCYAVCLDADPNDLRSGAKTAVGLLGKVPVTVVGKVEAGDLITSSGDGVGMLCRSYIPGTVIGKALENKNTHGVGQVLCLINPM